MKTSNDEKILHETLVMMHTYTTCSSPRCPLRSHSLVFIKNHLFILGIGTILNKELGCIFDLIALIVRAFIVRHHYYTKKIRYKNVTQSDFFAYKNITQSVQLFVYENVMQNALFLVYKNGTQSVLFFAYKNAFPPPPISKIQWKIA